MRYFAGFTSATENATVDKFSAVEFGNDARYSIHAAGASQNAVVEVYGGNIDTTKANMVALPGGATALNVLKEGNYFPYKYIGVQYTANGTLSGTYAVYFEQKNPQVIL